ncbi:MULTISPECIES: pilus assembly protein PilP [unclassified Herbaspirillum]|uniref:pilus assembly protein PilP n=1 Tax=unclassified Herbaspirillum TaxID=2624150 RepID=UPI00383ADDA0
MTRQSVRPFSPAILFALLLTSCAERDTPEQLRAQLDAIRLDTPSTQPVIQPANEFIPQAYPIADDGDAVTPFGHPATLPDEIDSNERPPQRGARQPLEGVPLESIRLVGTLSRDGRSDALLQVDKIVYPARAGDYLGQNFGVIRSIKDRRIELEELVRNGGNWEKRMTALELQGSGK